MKRHAGSLKLTTTTALVGFFLSGCQFNMGGSGGLLSLSPDRSTSKDETGNNDQISPISPEDQQSITDYFLQDDSKKRDHSFDVLPNLPKEAGVVRPTAQTTKLIYLCSEGRTQLRKFSYRSGSIGTDISTNFMVYRRDKFDFAYEMGYVELPGGLKFMIAYQSGRPNPLFYINMNDKPTLLAQNYERPYPAPMIMSHHIFDKETFQNSQVSEETLRDQAYHLNIVTASQPPKCGKPKDAPPSSPGPTVATFPNLVEKELKIFSAQLETTMSGTSLIQKRQSEKKCISALQVFGKDFSSFAKLTINSIVTGSGVNSNNLEGHSFRNVCTKNTVVALTSLEDSLKINGLKSYVMKIHTTIESDYPVEDVIIKPEMLFAKEQSWVSLPMRKNIKLSPYLHEISDYGDFKSLTAFVPLADIVDCDQVLENGKELAPQYPDITYSKSMELMGVFNTDLKYSFKYVSSDSENNGCEGSGPIKSPLLISFDPKGEVSTQANSLKFDVNGDGIDEEVSGWPTRKSKTAFLVLKHKGRMSGKFLFGNETDLSLFGLGSSFADGHEALAQLDVNKDGILDRNDKWKNQSLLSFIELWFDRNGNGKVERRERVALGHQGISAINLKVLSTPERVVSGDGSITTDSEAIIGRKIKLPIYDLWYKIK